MHTDAPRLISLVNTDDSFTHLSTRAVHAPSGTRCGVGVPPKDDPYTHIVVGAMRFPFATPFLLGHSHTDPPWAGSTLEESPTNLLSSHTGPHSVTLEGTTGSPISLHILTHRSPAA